jgi:hypothetical protein
MDADQAKAEVVRIARGILDGEMELVPACRAVHWPLALLGLHMDDDFRVFIGVDSESLDFPVGDERRHWHPDALRKLDPNLRAFETHHRPHVEDACRKLIARLG